MKINNIKNEINFKRRLTPKELGEYQATIKEAKTLSGQTGKSIFIMPSPNLPQSKEFNSGAGNFSSKYAQEYLDYMRSYIDFNVVEDLPPGQISPFKNFYCSYISSSLALGDQHINPELLATEEFENILEQSDLAKIVAENSGENKETLVNFKNVTSKSGAQHRALRKAYQNFISLDKNSKLKEEFKVFMEENSSWLNFERMNEDDLKFFKFKQFLAQKHLEIGKKELNKKGIKLCGDCPLRFSDDEVRAFPRAFKKNATMGIHSWNIPSLDFDSILDESSDAYKLFKTKIQLFAKRYDMIRFDVGWEYVTPIINTYENGQIKTQKKEMGSKLLEQIESWVKEIKGDDFDLKNLIWEFDAGPEDFKAFEGKSLIPPLRNRVKVYGSTHMHKNPYDKWGYNDSFLERGWKKDTFTLGIGNHDPQPLAQIAKNMPDEIKTSNGIIQEFHKKEAIEALSDILHIDKTLLENPRTFVDAKWADTMSCYNTHMFYMDVFGRSERFDKQDFNLITTPHENYAYKVAQDYKKAYHKSLQEGLGFNPARALELNLKAKGLDKQHPELFKKLQNFANILEAPEKIQNKSFAKKATPFVIGGLILSFGTLVYKKIKKTKSANKEQPKTPTPSVISFSEFQQNVSKKIQKL